MGDLDIPDIEIEKGAALAAALDQLFVQYPVRHYVDENNRRTALNYARMGSLKLAFMWAYRTGIPDDVLDALRGLLDE